MQQVTIPTDVSISPDALNNAVHENGFHKHLSAATSEEVTLLCAGCRVAVTAFHVYSLGRGSRAKLDTKTNLQNQMASRRFQKHRQRCHSNNVSHDPALSTASSVVPDRVYMSDSQGDDTTPHTSATGPIADVTLQSSDSESASQEPSMVHVATFDGSRSFHFGPFGYKPLHGGPFPFEIAYDWVRKVRSVAGTSVSLVSESNAAAQLDMNGYPNELTLLEVMLLQVWWRRVVLMEHILADPSKFDLKSNYLRAPMLRVFRDDKFYGCIVTDFGPHWTVDASPRDELALPVHVAAMGFD